MELNERELSIIDCALHDYHFQFVNDVSNQDLLYDIIKLITKLNKYD